MKTNNFKLMIATALILVIYSCKKGENLESTEIAEYNRSISSDSISSVATMSVKGKQFIKTADVNMEVKDVYESTLFIEKSVQNLGGFVTHSNLQSRVISEKTYNISNEDAMLIKKFQTENSMQVRVPTSNLGELLDLINNKKLFLNSRTIHAEDVTSNIKYAELEGKRIKKTNENISQLKNNKEKVKMGDENMQEENQQELANLNITDNLKYSTIDIFIKEPKLRVAEISVTNTKSIDNRYKFNFLHDAKNAFVEGFYLIQKFIIGVSTIWPFIIIGGIIIIFYRKNKANKKSLIKQENTQP